MKYQSIVMLALIVSFTYSCKENKKEAEKEAEMEVEEVQPMEKEVKSEVISFSMEAKSGSDVNGTVTFTEEQGKVSMVAELSGLSPGEHAIHIHDKADCSSDDGKSTGGHWNPTAEPHGEWGSTKGFHRGDIGNFEAGEDGSARVEFSTALWCLGCEDDTMNLIGKAVIVHQGVDDYTSQPSGAAGARISCAGIIE